MPPRKRNSENKSLPERWRYRNGTYSYMVPAGQEHMWDGRKEFKLGRNLADAYRVWADRLEYDGSEVSTFSALAERYRLEIIPETIQKEGLQALLVTTDAGKAVTIRGFNSVRQRHMKTAIERGYVRDRFTLHDLKRKGASDADQDATITTGNTAAMTKVYDVSKLKAKPTR